ncbi:unnamed protein product [Ilex paraguariensis]|uniref:Phorbol-ester/DAG-type domain-containing protein n=1 Tax=Ilex paraguariensis TaxID=185542 RepID=A0ABC8RLQ1_9AQUA
MHSSHPLILCTEPPSADSECKCHACGNFCRRLTYHCSLCEFYIHPLCVFQERTLKHESHEHILTLFQRPALFDCDACGMKVEGVSYVCIDCQFWIHNSCALLPSSLINSGHHPHSLNLAYSLPLESSNFTHDCNICAKKVKPLYWAYSCSQADALFINRTCRITADEKDIEPYLQKKGIQKDDSETTGSFVKHSSHEHPLQLFEQNTKVQSDKILFCNECEQPILAAFYYSCDKCSFSLHKYCAASLREVQHQCHPDHKLFLRTDSSNTSSPLKCDGCDIPCSGFTLNCDPCDFRLHFSCGSLLNSTVAHEAHSQYPLVPSKSNRCNACGMSAKFTLGCDTCGFYLDSWCVLLQGMIREELCDHPLILSYPPFTYHPDEFYCEMCRKEINPEFWLYHCLDCDLWLHPKCIDNKDYLNIMFGDTIMDESHGHALKCVEDAKDDSACNCSALNVISLSTNVVRRYPQRCNIHFTPITSSSCGRSNMLQNPSGVMAALQEPTDSSLGVCHATIRFISGVLFY